MQPGVGVGLARQGGIGRYRPRPDQQAGPPEQGVALTITTLPLAAGHGETPIKSASTHLVEAGGGWAHRHRI
jgi:hypothetical protein